MSIDVEVITGFSIVAVAAALFVRQLRREWGEENEQAGCSKGCSGCTIGHCATAHHETAHDNPIQSVTFLKHPVTRDKP